MKAKKRRTLLSLLNVLEWAIREIRKILAA